MVRFNLWTWSNSLRVWKAALKKEELSYSEKAINKGISYLENDVCDALSEACEKKKIINNKEIIFRKFDTKINGIIFQNLRDYYDGGVADFQTFLIDVFFYYFGKSNTDLMQDEFSYFKQIFDDMPNDFKKGISLAKKNKNKKKLLTIEFLNSRYLKN